MTENVLDKLFYFETFKNIFLVTVWVLTTFWGMEITHLTLGLLQAKLILTWINATLRLRKILPSLTVLQVMTVVTAADRERSRSPIKHLEVNSKNTLTGSQSVL